MSRPSIFTPILIGSCIIILVSFAVRSSFGVFQIPIASEFGWPRAEFSMAIAIQNLAWGFGQPMFSALGERYGDRRALLLGVLVYALGMLLSAYAVTPGQHQLLEVMVGFGVAGTGLGLILGIVGRTTSDKNRSMSLAIATAMGSGGQVFGPPIAAGLLSFLHWQQVFMVFAAVLLCLILVLPLLKAPPKTGPVIEEAMSTVLFRAFRDPSYTLIFLGFFSCGYQLGFMTAHFPALVTEMCGPIAPGSVLASLGISTTNALGAVALSLVGLANICGVLLAGWAGNHWPRKNLLAGVYLGRTLVAAAFILTPITPGTVVLFSLAMGSLWLASVPLTAGLVGYIYGLRYMGTLYGIVFLSHQIGSFMGVWLGGRLYDITGDYTMVWWIGIGVGAFSAIVHLPIRERPVGLPAAT